VFIAFDGIDGAGKSTQIRLLCEHLEKLGRSCVAVRDPGTTLAGEAIRKLVLDSDLEMHRRCEALLYMAARSQLVEQLIRPALAEEHWVISDRFLLANVVYQSVRGGEDAELLWRLGAIATGDLRPDVTILLDMPAEAAFARIDRPADRMESRGLEYLSAVREGFLKHVSSAGQHHIIVDANQRIETIHEEIIGRLSEWMTVR
jgi:dTMP kinase